MEKKTKTQIFQNSSTDLPSEMQVQPHSFTGCAHLGLPASSEEQRLPWGTEQHQHSASAISMQTQHGSGKLLLRTSILATFYSH